MRPILSILFTILTIFGYSSQGLSNQCSELFYSAKKGFLGKDPLYGLLNSEQLRSLKPDKGLNELSVRNLVEKVSQGLHMDPLFTSAEMYKQAFQAYLDQKITKWTFVTIAFLHSAKHDSTFRIKEVIDLRVDPKRPLLSYVGLTSPGLTPYQKISSIYDRGAKELDSKKQALFNKEFHNLPESEKFAWVIKLNLQHKNIGPFKDQLFFQLRDSLKYPEDYLSIETVIPSPGLLTLLSKYRFAINPNGIEPEYVIGIPSHNQMGQLFSRGKRAINVQPPKESPINTTIHAAHGEGDTGKTYPLFGYVHDLFHLKTATEVDPSSSTFRNFFPNFSRFLQNKLRAFPKYSFTHFDISLEVESQGITYRLKKTSLSRSLVENVVEYITDLYYTSDPKKLLSFHYTSFDTTAMRQTFFVMLLKYRTQVNIDVHKEFGISKEDFDKYLTQGLQAVFEDLKQLENPRVTKVSITNID